MKKGRKAVKKIRNKRTKRAKRVFRRRTFRKKAVARKVRRSVRRVIRRRVVRQQRTARRGVRSVRRKVARRVSRAVKRPMRVAHMRTKAVRHRRLKKKIRRAAKARTRAAARSDKDTPILEALTGSPVRARVLRLLLREPHITFSLKDASERIGIPRTIVRREALLLQRAGFLTMKGGKHRLHVIPTFPFAAELRRIVVESFPMARTDLLKILSRIGTLRLVVVSGVFLNVDRARIDLFVVVNRFSEKRLNGVAQKIEQAVGAELRWAGMSTKEFMYRWGMFDRFVRDILTHPHEKVLEKIKLS